MNELNEYFKFKCWKGLEARGLSDKQEYIERLRYEMDVICGMDFCGYFLITQDILNWATSKGILRGPARGSAGGSLVCYCLNIITMDPIKHGLIFERFMNPSRVSMPDIDNDFQQSRRDEVIQYCIDKYGKDCVTGIGTFGYQKAKSIVKNVARTLGFDLSVGAKLSNLLLLPVSGKTQSISVSIEKVPELNKIYNGYNSEEKIVLDWSLKLENTIKSVGQHACGHIIADQPVCNRVPTFNKDGFPISQWGMNEVEDAGFVKFDFLAVAALDKIARTLSMIKKRYGTDIDIYNLPLDDEKVYEMLREGKVLGVFQLEGSAVIKDTTVKVKPDQFEDIVVISALCRPGPLCLSGDTKVLCSIHNGRGRVSSRNMTMKELYDIYAQKTELDKRRNPRWLQSFDLNTRALVNNKIVDIYKSGAKEVFKLRIQTGLTKGYKEYVPSKTNTQRKTDYIKATLDHKFYTLNGWKQLRDITPGEYVAIYHSRSFGRKRKDNTSVYGRKNFANIAFRHYEYRCIFCDWNKGTLDVHHIEGNRNQDNSPNNLCFLCPNHHREVSEGRISIEKIRDHQQKYRLPYSTQMMYVKFLGLQSAGTEETYDIEMTAPYNNFIAGDFVVHNSSGYVDRYINRKNGTEPVEYLIPSMESILGSTYGVMAYQEQLMEITRVCAGFSMAEADIARKGVAKKKEKVLKELKPKFIDGWIKQDNPRDKGELLWQDFLNCSDYLFNRCVSGDTKFHRNVTKANCRSYTVEELYKIKNDSSFAKSIKAKSMRSKILSKGYGKAWSMNQDNKIILNDIVDIRHIGTRKVYKTTTESGSYIKTTHNHKFPTTNGVKKLCDIDTDNDLLYLNDGWKPSDTSFRFNTEGNNLPTIGQRGFQKRDTSYTRWQQYKEKHKDCPCGICSRQNCRIEIHHIDGNHGNNNIDNLIPLCVSCHKKEHYKQNRNKMGRAGLSTRTERIVSIEYIGIEDVYDVEMTAPYHNFTVDTGIVTSNSHSLAYSLITYYTAYLKANYPEEFMCAVMAEDAGDRDQMIRCFAECNRMGINVRPPDVNQSIEDFSLNNRKEIVFGLGGIKNVGGTSRNIISERKKGSFIGLEDFCRRLKKSLNKKKVESLVRAGAFDSMSDRATSLRMIDSIWDFNTEIKKYDAKMTTYRKRLEAFNVREKERTQGSKKASLKRPEEPVSPRLVEVLDTRPLTEDEMLSDEQEMLGMYVSSHPLISYEEAGILGMYGCSISNVLDLEQSEKVKLLLLVSNVQEITTRKKQKMAFVFFEDLTGNIEGVVFPRQYDKLKELLKKNSVVEVNAAAEIENIDENKVVKLIVNGLRQPGKPNKRHTKPINITIEENKLNELGRLVKRMNGEDYKVNVKMMLQSGTKSRFSFKQRVVGPRSVFQKEVTRLNETK